MLSFANMFGFLFVLPSSCPFKLVEVRNTHAREVRNFDASRGAKTSDRGTEIGSFIVRMEREKITELAKDDLEKTLRSPRT